MGFLHVLCVDKKLVPVWFEHFRWEAARRRSGAPVGAETVAQALEGRGSKPHEQPGSRAEAPRSLAVA